jgi:hypothetical protein
VVLYAGDGIVLERLQHCGSPVRNRSGLVASRAGERKGNGGGGYGLLIAAGMRRLEWGVKELKRGVRVTGNGRRREERLEIEDDWQVGSTHQ